VIPQESPLPVYFHGMVAKAKAGELNLVRTIWGLRQAKAARECVGRPMH
jgi:hypothetical protein